MEMKDLYNENYQTLMKKIRESIKMERYHIFMVWKN